MGLKFNPFTGKLDFTGSAGAGGAPSGPAGGDLAGTYPNPTVDGLQGNPVSAITPASGQTLQWNGAAWIPGAIPNGGSGGGGLFYFFNYQNTTGISPTTGLPTSPVAVSQFGRTYSVGSGSITSANLIDGSYSLICGFVTQAADPGVTSIPAGLWDFNIWADVLGGTGVANQTQFQVRVYKYNPIAGTYTSIANSDDIFVYDPITTAQYIANVTIPQTTILATDRIYVELWAQKNVNQSRQIRFYFDSLHPSHGHTTIPSVAGTGVVKVVNGVFQSPATTIVDADVSPTAGIAVSKLSGTLPVANGGTGRTVGNYSIYGLEIHVGKDGNDTTGDGTLINPVLTITKALTLVGSGRNTIIVHPGGYSESPTVTSANTTIATSELTGANTELTGTLTLSAAARVSGLKMANLTITGSGNTYISNCTVDTRVIKSGSNYLEIINSELQCTAGVQITGAGTVSIVGNKCWAVAVSNAAANVLIKDCFQVLTPSVTAGILQFDGCAIFAAAPTTNAVTASAGTNITLANSFVLNSIGTSVERVSLLGSYSILNLVYDKANSTLTGTNLNAIDYFSVINAETLNLTNDLSVSDGGTGASTAAGARTNLGAIGGSSGAVDNAILRADGTGGATLQNSDLNIDDATVTTQANVAITNQHSGQTNSAIVLTPKGTGALIAGPKPDGTATGGGNARGARAIDLQLARSAASQVANGAGSVAIGQNNTASDSEFGSVSIGNGNTSAGGGGFAAGLSNTVSTAYASVALGRLNSSSGGSGSCAIGQSNVASGSSAFANGTRASADRLSMQAHSAGFFAASGDAQRARFVLRCKTTTNSAVEMALDGATTYLGIPSGKVISMTINISGVSSTGGSVAHYVRQYAVKNVGGTSSEVYAPVTIGSDNPSGTTIALSANNGDDTLRILVTGIAAETWRWVASVDAVEIAYGV